MRINDRFYKGGNSFPGFQTAGIGPRDLNFASNGASDALGGKIYAIGAVELTVPSSSPRISFVCTRSGIGSGAI